MDLYVRLKVDMMQSRSLLSRAGYEEYLALPVFLRLVASSSVSCCSSASGFNATKAGRPMQPGVNQHLVQRVVKQRAHEAAQRLPADAKAVVLLECIGIMLDLAKRLG